MLDWDIWQKCSIICVIFICEVYDDPMCSYLPLIVFFIFLKIVKYLYWYFQIF